MLDRPEILKSHLLSQHDLSDDLFIGVLHNIGGVGLRNLDFIHHAELHMVAPLFCVKSGRFVLLENGIVRKSLQAGSL